MYCVMCAPTFIHTNMQIHTLLSNMHVHTKIRKKRSNRSIKNQGNSQYYLIIQEHRFISQKDPTPLIFNLDKDHA